MILLLGNKQLLKTRKTMGIYQKKHSKEQFLKFLEKNNENNVIISKFVRLPMTVNLNGNIFKLDIGSTWYRDGDTHYAFELNYYSEELIEYLYSSKVFNNVETSINYLLCELINNSMLVEK